MGPGRVRVLLASSRWERRFVRFLEMSGVGRVMGDGVDEDGAWAAQTDESIAWETGARLISPFLFVILLLGGIHTPRSAHSAPLGETDFLCLLYM